MRRTDELKIDMLGLTAAFLAADKVLSAKYSIADKNLETQYRI